MDDLVGWLGEQLDADTARATEAGEELGPDWHYDDGYVLARREDDMVATGSQAFLEAERGRFIAEWDPARVLREIDAKRELLRRYEAMAADVLVLTSGVQEILSEYRRVILPSLAAGYSDRPGYREEWRP